LKKIINIIIFVSVIILTTGCTIKTYTIKKDAKKIEEINKVIVEKPIIKEVEAIVKDKIILPPNSFRLRVEIEEYKVTNMEVLDEMEYILGQIRQVGKYLSVDRVMIKLKVDNFPSYYWLAYLPHENDINDGYGVKTIYAELNDDDIVSKYQNLNIPPNNIKVHVWFQNGKVIRNEFEKFRPWWGRFYFFERNKEKQLDRFKNDTYPSRIWEAMYPRNANNEQILTLELME